jgi:hypothetical protein
MLAKYTHWNHLKSSEEVLKLQLAKKLCSLIRILFITEAFVHSLATPAFGR